MMFLNFFSDLNATDKVFFSVIIGALLIILIWFIVGKILNNIANKKVKEAKSNLENINNSIKDDNTVKSKENVSTHVELTEKETVESSLIAKSQEAKTEVEATEKAESKVEEDAEAESEVQEEVETEPEVEEEAEAESKVQEEVETEPEVEEEAEAESKVQEEVEAEPEVEEEAETESKVQEEVETEPKVEEEAETESKVQEEVEAEPEVEKDAEAESKTQEEAKNKDFVTLPLENEERPVDDAQNLDEKETESVENQVQEHLTIKPEIEVEEKKGRSYNGKYEVYQVAGGYAYHLKASNGEILVVSETFSTREGVIKAIDVVKKNLETGTIRFFSDKKGKFKFKLVSKNYRVLLISSNYPTEKSAIRASESFKKFAMKADIVDIELVDTESKKATIISIQSRDSKPGGKFHIEKFNGEYSWDLKASNGQILCQADGYTTKAGCLNSIESFKKNVTDGVFKCVKDKTGRYCYKLYTQNGRVCVVGESYTTKSSAESAANSVVAFYQLADIVEIK